MKTLRLFLFLLPLVYFPWANQQFELVKFVWLLAAGLGVWTLERVYRIWKYGELDISTFKKYPIWWGIGVLYMLYITAQTLLISISPQISFWGTYQRHGGLLLLYGLVWLLLLMVTRPWSEKEKESLISTIALSGTAVAVLGLGQKILSSVLLMLPDLSQAMLAFGDLQFTLGRTFATMGHPNFLGQFLLTTIIVSLFVVIYAKQKRLYWVISIVLQTIALTTTWNRASILTLALIALIGMLFFLYKKYGKKLLPVIGAVLGVSVIGLLAWVFFHTDTRSATTRSVLYPAVVSMIEQRPLVGYGLDTFGSAFSQFFPKGVGETENFTDLPDKAHNEILDVLAEQGIVGLTILILLLLVTLWYNGGRLLKDTYMLLACVVICATLLTNLASFSVVTHKIIFIVFLGLLLLPIKPERVTLPSLQLKMLLGSSVLIALLFLKTGIFFLLGDVAYAEYKKTSDETERKALYELAIGTSPFPYEYILFGPAASLSNAQPLLDQALAINKYDIYVYFSQAGWQKTRGDFSKAKEYLTQAQNVCPNCPEVTYRQAVLAHETNDKEMFETAYVQYLDLLPWFVFESRETLEPALQNRQRIFLKEQKDAIMHILDIKNPEKPLSEKEAQLQRNVE